MRRANRERIYEAQWTGLRNRIRDQWRQTEAAADMLLLDWQAQAPTLGLDRAEPAYWDEAARWTAERITEVHPQRPFTKTLKTHQ